MKYCGQHNSFYYQSKHGTDLSHYQLQPAKYNQSQHYCQDIRTKQACSKNDYDREKVGRHGNIHSGIPTPNKESTHYSMWK